MIKPIVTLITELKKPCLEVEEDENIKSLIQDLKDTLNSVKGWGISANQIGVNKRVSYIKVPKFMDPKTKEIKYSEYILINAKIIEKDKPVKIENEGCLSFPGVYVHTRRYIFITVVFENEKRQVQTGTMQDYEALATQHEIDHQNGIVIFNRKWRAK